jgi:hypothetical protein
LFGPVCRAQWPEPASDTTCHYYAIIVIHAVSVL